MAVPDDATIPDDAAVWRRIPPQHYPRHLTRPASAAFEDNPDGSLMSVVIGRSGRNPKEILAGHEGFGVATIPAGFFRECGLGITRDPTKEEPDHALVHGAKTHSVGKRLAKKANLIIEPTRPA